MKRTDEKHDLSRRDFIKTTGVTAASLLAAPRVIAAQPPVNVAPVAAQKVLGANDRINYGFIGVGNMGGKHLSIIKDFCGTQNVAILGACDVFEKRRAEAKEKNGLSDEQLVTDYRRLIENKDIDVLVISTPDHWHGRIAVEALQAGKHVYLEKPMTRTLAEGFQVYDAAKRANRWVQVGSHGCSDPKWHKAREIVTAKTLGTLLWAQGSYCRNNPKGEWNYKIEPEASAETIDWKTWLGSAPDRPFSAERYYRWRKYWDYGTGIIGDLWPHRLHPLLLALALNEFPKSVSCVGGRLCDTDNKRGELREVADTTMLMVEFPSGVMLHVAGSTVNERGVEDIIRGQKANLLFGGGKVQLQPERPYVEEIEASDQTPPDSGESHVKNQQNFLDSLRKNVAPSCDIELAIRVQTIVSMAEESYRKGRMAHFDPVKRVIV